MTIIINVFLFTLKIKKKIETETHIGQASQVVEDDLKVLLLLPLPPKC